MMTPIKIPRMLMIANPFSVDKSMIISGNIAMITVAAEVMMITKARFSLFR